MTGTTDITYITELTADIVSAYVSKNTIVVSDVPALIADVSDALSKAAAKSVLEPKADLKPAVSIKKSVTPDYIICLEDGQKFKSLKRHLRSHYDMSPDEYRDKWNLPYDYPMVSPAYAEKRSQLAKKIGLGRKSKR